MTSSITAGTQAPSVPKWPAILTWRAYGEPRMESARVQIVGNRVRAAGRIVGGLSEIHPSFSASYDLVTDEAGVIERVTLRTTLTSGVKHTSLTHDEEGFWTVITANSQVRLNFEGAIDLDLGLSPFFSTLTLRRLRREGVSGEVVVPVVAVNLFDLTFREQEYTYRIDGDSVEVSHSGETVALTVDADGIVSDYPGLAERV